MTDDLERPVRYLNLGGNLECLSPVEVDKLLRRLREFVLPDIEIIFEPGSFWFQGARHAVCKVLAVEPLFDDGCRVVVDMSRDCHLRWSEPCLIHEINPGAAQTILFFGPTCHEGDLLGAFRVPRRADGSCAISQGDCLLFGAVDAYSSAWNTSFNGIEKAHMLVYGKH